MKVPDCIIQSAADFQAIFTVAYKGDILPAVSDVYQDIVNLLNLKRGSSETIRNFETSFEADVSKFNSHFDSSVISGLLNALCCWRIRMLIAVK